MSHPSSASLKPPLPVIVTRAEPGARQTCQRLAERGYLALSSPTLELTANPDAVMPEMETVSGLVFTSANGVRFFTAQSSDRTHSAWCVGPATAEAARVAGFEQVHQSSGNALQLAEFILARGGRSAKPLLHIANAAAEGKLAERLSLANQAVDFVPLYQAEPALKLSISVTKTLESQMPCLLLVHSAKAALAFAYLAKGLPVGALIGVAISDQAAAPLRHLDLPEVLIADHPDEDGLFAALKKAYPTLSS